MIDQDVIEKLRSVVAAGVVSQRPPRGNRRGTWILSVYRKDDLRRILLEVVPHFGVRRRAKALAALDILNGIVNEDRTDLG
jgi:hypothetical protein